MSGTGRADFERDVLRHLDAAYNLARWLVRREEDARDVVQDAYLRAIRSRETFSGTDTGPWLMAIVRNACYTCLSKRKSAKRESINMASDEGQDEPAAPREHADPAMLAARAADQELLARALDQLPIEFREVIVLHELQGLAYKEIAAIADIPIGTVMSRLARARQRLADELMRPQYKDLRLAL